MSVIEKLGVLDVDEEGSITALRVTKAIQRLKMITDEMYVGNVLVGCVEVASEPISLHTRSPKPYRLTFSSTAMKTSF